VVVLIGVLSCALVAGSPALADDSGKPSSSQAAQQTRQHDVRRDLHPEHTSDGQPGWIAPPATGRLGRSAPVRRTDVAERTIAPGVTLTQWTQIDARGPIQAHLLAIDTKTPGLRIDYADSGKVQGVASVRDILKRSRNAVAGVNGDFYDIGRTGAPLGIGKDRQRGLLHGRTSGWNSAFAIVRGRPMIGQLPLKFRVRKHPKINVTSLNSPYVLPNSVGYYTSDWGPTGGHALTQGQRKRVVGVWIKNKKVVRKSRKLPPKKPVKGSLLVGRGAGAKQLMKLKPGARVVVRSQVEGNPKMVITGNQTLIDDGIVTVIDNKIMHPRTAVGIDNDTGEVLLLVVDGRSTASRGYTMLELANLMVDLGADEALNLDGGGSSTMVARGGNGRNRVVNVPSDGGLRRVTNALEVTYTPPK
jgi:hypothetical protein